MSARRSHLSLQQLYVTSQITGWGSFLILRLMLTAAYAAKTPHTSTAAICAIEAVSHLLCAGWSHCVWLWLRRSNLIERGWKRLGGEGMLVALTGSTALLLLLWPSYRIYYAHDLNRFGDDMIWMALGQNTLITVLWFWPLVALLYFDRVRRLELEHAEARAAAREAQLHALRGQVNPHFLFNSFNSLRALITLDPERAAQALTQLSSLLRYSLAQADQLVVPLAEELLIVRRYLDLEKLRLGDRLSVVAEIPENVDGVLIPPMLLQGLVENAIKFGPAARKAGGAITYRATVTDGRLRVRLTNPGRLAHVDPTSTSLGLRNLRDRLRLLYGREATFTLGEEEGVVVASLDLPTRPLEPASAVEPARHHAVAPSLH